MSQALLSWSESKASEFFSIFTVRVLLVQFLQNDWQDTITTAADSLHC